MATEPQDTPQQPDSPKEGNPAPKTGRKVIDWEALEIVYRAGMRSLKDMGNEFGVSDAAIVKRAKRDGWERDLRAKIKAKADAKVRAAVVSDEVRARTKITESVVVEHSAALEASIRLTQRKDVHRAKSITMRLFEELELQAGPENAAMLAQLGELMANPGENGQDKLNDLYQKIISLPGRAKTMKDLGESLKNLILLERQAYGLDDKDTAPETGLAAMATDELKRLRAQLAQ